MQQAFGIKGIHFRIFHTPFSFRTGPHQTDSSIVFSLAMKHGGTHVLFLSETSGEEIRYV